jgi:hypothetical protein
MFNKFKVTNIDDLAGIMADVVPPLRDRLYWADHATLTGSWLEFTDTFTKIEE